MLTKDQLDATKSKALEYFAKAGIILTKEEEDSIEVVDFCLGEIEIIGLSL